MADLSLQGVEKESQVLLRSVREGHLDHLSQLLSVAINEAGLEGALKARGHRCDILLCLCLLERLALLTLRGRGKYRRHGCCVG